MKVSFEINNRQLFALNRMWNTKMYGETIANRVLVSVIEKLADKMIRRAITRRHQPPSKTFKVTIEYHEAYYLSEHLWSVMMFLTELSYEYNVCQDLRNKIDQLLKN